MAGIHRMLCPDTTQIQYLAGTLGDTTRGRQDKIAEESALMRQESSCGNIDEENIAVLCKIRKARAETTRNDTHVARNYARSALSRSACKSSTSSMPTEMRTSPG